MVVQLAGNSAVQLVALLANQMAVHLADYLVELKAGQTVALMVEQLAANWE